MIQLFDAHCHLQDDRLQLQTREILIQAQDANVFGFSCCGTSESDWAQVESLSDAYTSIVPSFGLHPWYATERSELWLDILEQLFKTIPQACCGEIGLDHARDPATFEVQESVFCDQLALANKYNRPVSIHCHKAFGRMIELLQNCGGVPQGGILHSYSGTPELLPTFVNLGLSISFSGSLTFQNNKRARASIHIVPFDRLLIETDSPDIKPYGCLADFNEPANLFRVAQEIADIRKIAVDTIAEHTWNNSQKMFLFR